MSEWNVGVARMDIIRRKLFQVILAFSPFFYPNMRPISFLDSLALNIRKQAIVVGCSQIFESFIFFGASAFLCEIMQRSITKYSFAHVTFSHFKYMLLKCLSHNTTATSTFQAGGQLMYLSCGLFVSTPVPSYPFLIQRLEGSS